MGDSAARTQYFKGILFLNTLRSVVNDDAKWFAMIHDLFQKFKYQNIMTEDIMAYMNQYTGMNLTPIFDQYLRHVGIPTLELKFDDAKGAVKCRWRGGCEGICDADRGWYGGDVGDCEGDDGQLADDEDAAEEE